MVGPFGDPGLCANPLVLSIVRPPLGNDVRLNSVTVVTSYPGADQQHIHRDHYHLYLKDNISTMVPASAFAVAVPLIDVALKTGPTAVWLGSHRWMDREVAAKDCVAKSLARGDCLIYDFRTLHTGNPNKSKNLKRPILFMVYARPWFFDEINFLGRKPLNLPQEQWESFDDLTKSITLRAYSAALREHPELALKNSKRHQISDKVKKKQHTYQSLVFWRNYQVGTPAGKNAPKK